MSTSETSTEIPFAIKGLKGRKEKIKRNEKKISGAGITGSFYQTVQYCSLPKKCAHINELQPKE